MASVEDERANGHKKPRRDSNAEFPSTPRTRTVKVWLDCDPGQLKRNIQLFDTLLPFLITAFWTIVDVSYLGHDDAFAILLAAHSKFDNDNNNDNKNNSIELIGISTVAGNQTVDKTTHNALKGIL